MKKEWSKSQADQVREVLGIEEALVAAVEALEAEEVMLIMVVEEEAVDSVIAATVSEDVEEAEEEVEAQVQAEVVNHTQVNTIVQEHAVAEEEVSECQYKILLIN